MESSGRGFILQNHPLVDQLAAGCIAGATSTILLHPLDLLKTRFQATVTNQHRTLFSVPRELAHIYHQGGVPGLYRGFSANFAGGTVSWGVYFLLYRWIQSTWGTESLAGWQYFVSSGAAGALTVLGANPLWMAKTRLCQPLAAALQYRGLIDCLSKTWRSEGVRGLYRGFVPGLIGTSHGAAQFLAYEEMKKFHRRRKGSEKPKVSEFLLMSSLSKVFASAVTYPYQVVRCRLQLTPDPSNVVSSSQSLGSVILRTWRGEGLAGFYKGIVPNTIRVLPGTCVTFLVYEQLCAFFKKHAA